MSDRDWRCIENLVIENCMDEFVKILCSQIPMISTVMKKFISLSTRPSTLPGGENVLQTFQLNICIKTSGLAD